MTCPICKKTTTQKFRPFCSEHCANIDLGRWFNGAYRTPSLREEEPEDANSPSWHEENP